MLPLESIKRVLNTALRNGGDLAEVYLENTETLRLGLDDQRLEQATRGNDIGGGVRVFYGDTAAYAYTDDLAEESLVEAAKAAAAAARGSAEHRVAVDLTKREHAVYAAIERPYDEMSTVEKANHSIAGALASALSAQSMQRSRSFLQGKTGQTVASDMVTLLDNGRLPGGLGTRPFDDEGVPTGATRLIDEGVLQAVLHDTYTAAREGTDSSTGNASRPSHAGLPSVAPSNFYFQPGLQTPKEVIAGVEKGLYVESVMNTHSINPISGDYSVSAKGYWIENGQIVHPVNEVTIAIPLQDWLHNVSGVANDLLFMPMGGVLGAPTIRVDHVMIGGSG